MWDPYPNAASFTDTVGAFYSELTARSRPGFDVAAKPWGLAEWGYAGTDQTKAYATYDEARRDLDSGVFPRLKAHVVWDNKVAGGNDDRVGFDNAGTADPTEQADYNAFAADPRLRDDVTAPTAPTSLAATLSRSTVALSWTAAQDAVGVAAYTVYRGGVAIGTSTASGYTDATAPPGHRAVYTVRASDPSGNVGEASSPLSVAVPDTTAPSRVAGLTATPGTGRITLAWRPATDNIGVTSYRVFRGSTRVATVAASARGFVNTGLRARTLYSYSVFARDASGNQSPAAAVSARTR